MATPVFYFIGGHGAGDPGAGGNGYTESTEARSLNSLIAKYVKQLGGKAVIYNTKRDMYQQSAKGKGLYAWDHPSNYVVIETHFNAFNKKARGTEVLVKSGSSSDKYDKAINKALAKYFTNRGIKKRYDLLNMNIAAQKGINYRLVEVCFIDSKKDMEQYKKNKDAIARLIAEGLVGKKFSKPKPTPPKPAVEKPIGKAEFMGNDGKKCFINIYKRDKVGKQLYPANYFDRPIEIAAKGRNVYNSSSGKSVDQWASADSKKYLFAYFAKK